MCSRCWKFVGLFCLVAGGTLFDYLQQRNGQLLSEEVCLASHMLCMLQLTFYITNITNFYYVTKHHGHSRTQPSCQHHVTKTKPHNITYATSYLSSKCSDCLFYLKSVLQNNCTVPMNESGQQHFIHTLKNSNVSL